MTPLSETLAHSLKNGTIYVLSVYTCISYKTSAKKHIHKNIENTEVQPTYYFGQNVCRRFHILVKFLSATRETKLDYYYQKVNVRVQQE